MKYCQQCEIEYEGNEAFCAKCGGKLTEKAEPEIVASVGEKKRFCTQCGSEYKENVVLCGKCGNKLAGNMAQKPPDPVCVKTNCCPHCGSQVNENAIVCVKCGCALQKNVVQNTVVPNVTKPTRKNKVGLYITGTVSVLIIIVVIVVLQLPKGYKVGDRGPANGSVFYDKGIYSDGWRYLEVAPGRTEVNKAWGLAGVACTVSSMEIGSGKENTAKIVRQLTANGETGKAAQFCQSINFGEHQDWFLPSAKELEVMIQVLRDLGIGGTG